jgi:FMN phosphatase YigB (HAD superfamily)
LEAKYKARPRALEVFDALHGAGIKCAVYSDYPNVAERLTAIGLPPDRCGALYGPDTFGALKPAPRPFLTIAQDLHCAPEDTLVIGDREDTDGDGARACGMRFILLRTGKNKQTKADEFLSWDEFADYVCKTQC